MPEEEFGALLIKAFSRPEVAQVFIDTLQPRITSIVEKEVKNKLQPVMHKVEELEEGLSEEVKNHEEAMQKFQDSVDTVLDKSIELERLMKAKKLKIIGLPVQDAPTDTPRSEHYTKSIMYVVNKTEIQDICENDFDQIQLVKIAGSNPIDYLLCYHEISSKKKTDFVCSESKIEKIYTQGLFK